MKKSCVKYLTASLVLFTSILSFQSSNVSAIEKGTILKPVGNGQIDWTNKIIRVKGSGAPPSTGGVAQKRLKARVAARMDAYRNLAEIVSGVQVTSETVIDNFVTKSDVIRLKVDAVIKGARQSGNEKVLPDGSVELEIFLPLFGNGSIASALDLGNYLKKTPDIETLIPYQVAMINDFNLPAKTIKVVQVPNEPTGLIIDARDLGVEPAMSPFIVGGGKIVYAAGKVEIDPDKIVNNGVTDYFSTMEEAKMDLQRIGKSPMEIEAKGAVGKPVRTNILLDELSIEKLVEANQKYKFLDNLKVVLVI